MPQPEAHAERFTGLAGTYARFRPSYPTAAFNAMLEGLARDGRAIAAVDVGCGTGISTRLLAAAGARVVGVDCNADMLDEARRDGESSTAITWHRAAAEATGLESGGFDLVLCAQAFHWFDQPMALAEFARLLRPHGRLALLWNIRDGSDPFTAAYSRIIAAEADRVDPTMRDAREALDAAIWNSVLFEGARRLEFDSPQPLDEEGVLGRALSASYFPREKPRRSELLEALRAAFREHARGGVATLAHRARLTLATRVA